MSNLFLLKFSPHIDLIFILHGSGHLAIFPDTIKTNKQKKQILKLVNITSYLAAVNINIHIICPESQFPHKQQQAFLVSWLYRCSWQQQPFSFWIAVAGLILEHSFFLEDKNFICLMSDTWSPHCDGNNNAKYWPIARHISSAMRERRAVIWKHSLGLTANFYIYIYY